MATETTTRPSRSPAACFRSHQLFNSRSVEMLLSIATKFSGRYVMTSGRTKMWQGERSLFSGMGHAFARRIVTKGHKAE